MIYGVRTFFVAARWGNESTYCSSGGACGCGGRPPPVCSARVAGSDELWQTKENLVLFVQGSLTHLFTLILFEPTRRGQTLGRWNVDPVHAALLWTGLFVRSGLTICSAGASPKGTLISSISSSRFGGGLSSKSNALILIDATLPSSS
jgi:hypothetical protein